MSQSVIAVPTRCPVRPNVSPRCNEWLGNLCEAGDFNDSPDSLSDTAAGWPIFGQFVAHDITA